MNRMTRVLAVFAVVSVASLGRERPDSRAGRRRFVV